MLKSAVDFISKEIRHLERRRLKRDDFSIISNNCWGGFVHQYYGMPYKSPFVGLFLFAPDYLKLLQNLKFYMDQKLTFMEKSKTRYRTYLEMWRTFDTYPIGLLGDLEVHFQHYDSEKEAEEKWNRRTPRINYDNLIVKFCDRDGCTREHLELFDNLPYERKICNTAKAFPYKTCLQLANCSHYDNVENEWQNFLKTVKLTKFMNDFYSGAGNK